MSRGDSQISEKGGQIKQFSGTNPDPSHNTTLKRVKVLVADDEKDLLEIYSRALGEYGFEVSIATCGNEAVTKFIEVKPEVIILDYRMAKGNGLEAAAEILSMKPSAKIIMLTADGTVLEEAERIGVELFLEKPISLQALTNAVMTLLSLKATSAIISR
jgi:DNA-binding NtrC family response regulator